MLYYLQQYLITFGWALTGALSFVVALSIAMKVYTWFSPIDDWQEIKNGNVAFAYIRMAVNFGVAFVIGLIVMS